MKYCSHCGAEMAEDAVYCPKCGRPVNGSTPPVESNSSLSSKDWLATLLLCFFLGVFGAHRFYVGKIGSAILMLLTIGGFGIWTLVDLILIICSDFKDRDGKVIKRL